MEEETKLCFQTKLCFATCEKGDSEVKGASIGDCGAQWPEDAMLAGLGTDESGERGGKRGLKRRRVQVWTFQVFQCPR